MIVLDCVNDFQKSDFFRKDYDDLFSTMIEFHYRIAKGGMVLDAGHLDGVAGQELNIKDECCKQLYVIFVFLTANAWHPTYVLAILKDYVFKSYQFMESVSDSLSISRIYVMYLLMEISLIGECAGVLSKAKRIANLSITFCSADICEYCFETCRLISNLEARDDYEGESH